MAAVVLKKVSCFLLSCQAAVAFSSRQRGDFIRYEGRPPTQRHRSISSSLLALAKAEKNIIPGKGETHANQSKDIWVLLVEDEDDLRSAIGSFLAKEGGYHVTGVSDARSAILVCRGMVRPNSRNARAKNVNQDLDALSNNSTNATAVFPDCLILDIRLLGSMDGLDLLKIIRSDPLLESLPVVLLTAKGKVEDRIVGYEAGADAYLPKPFDPEELLSIVNGLLSRDKLSIKGEADGGTMIQNDNTDNPVYGDLKRELMEIKALMHGIDSPRSLSQTDNPMSAESLRSEILDMKDVIKSENNLPPQSSEFVDQYTLSVLSPEETDIMKLVSKGTTNKGIATEMQCSISKIEKHMTAMFEKAAVKRRADLIDWWVQSMQDEDTNTATSNSQLQIEETPGEIVSVERPASSLTAEEKNVMNLLGAGMTTEEIISKTQSTKRKIEKHLKDLLHKAKVQNRTELLRWWRANAKENEDS